MSLRFDHTKTDPKAMQAMYGLQRYVNNSDLDTSLVHLIELRASQINGCAYCMDMHSTAALEAGEKPQRLLTLSAWRETPFFEPHERAALALTEALTLVSEGGVSDEVYAEASKYYDDELMLNLIMTIVTINGWNRIALATGMQPPAAKPGSTD